MRVWLAGFMLVGFLLDGVEGSAKAEETIRFATEGAFPPFNERAADGSLIGFEIDLGMALCAKMHRKCEFVAQEWEGMIPGLLAKKYDGIFASMSITEERKRQINFTNKYYDSGGIFIAPAGTAVNLEAADLDGKAIGTLAGSTYLCYLEKTYPAAKITSYPNAEALYLDLTSSRLDAIFADAVASDYGFLRTESGKGMALASKVISDPECFGEGAGIGLRKEDDALREQLNKAILESRADGTYQEIAKKYFSYDIYGE